MAYVDTELSVVTNAIAYACEGGVPPHAIEISDEQVATYRYAAYRALVALEGLRALPPVDPPYDWVFDPDIVGEASPVKLTEPPHGEPVSTDFNHWSAWPVEHGLDGHCCLTGCDLMNCGCCRTHPAIGCQSAVGGEPWRLSQ